MNEDRIEEILTQLRALADDYAGRKPQSYSHGDDVDIAMDEGRASAFNDAASEIRSLIKEFTTTPQEPVSP